MYAVGIYTPGIKRWGINTGSEKVPHDIFSPRSSFIDVSLLRTVCGKVGQLVPIVVVTTVGLSYVE